MSEPLFAQSDRVATRTIDGCAVVVVIDSQELLELDEVGTFVWEQLREPVALMDVAARVCSEFEVGIGVAEVDVRGFVDSLCTAGAATRYDG